MVLVRNLENHLNDIMTCRGFWIVEILDCRFCCRSCDTLASSGMIALSSSNADGILLALCDRYFAINESDNLI
uniref:Uncharacterized protein n=1 Tax=Rhizophagus irregularis (strain DAOM 181602 / DAOM 197198 / MUCL 43194) TaxID=747089 RepID=U9TMN3_RHIID